MQNEFHVKTSAWNYILLFGEYSGSQEILELYSGSL